MRTQNSVRFVAIALAIVACAPAARSQPMVTMSVSKDQGSPIYRYSLSNQGQKSIVAVILGDNQPTGPCTLQLPPLGWTVDAGLPPTSARAPIGWVTQPFVEEDIGTMCIGWRPASTDSSVNLAPGSVTTDFMIFTASDDPSYLSAPAKVIFSDGSMLKTGVR